LQIVKTKIKIQFLLIYSAVLQVFSANPVRFLPLICRQQFCLIFYANLLTWNFQQVYQIFSSSSSDIINSVWNLLPF